MERQKTLAKFIKFIKEKEFGDDIIGDGNCLYRCLSKYFYGHQQRHEQIRHEIIQYMSDDELMTKEEKINRYFRKFMSKNDGYDDYLTLHSEIGEWAEAPIIQASVDKYCLYIFVSFYTIQKEVIRMIAKPVQAERKNYKSIFLNFENNHYTIKAKDLKVSPEEPWFDLLGLPEHGPEQYEYSSLALDYKKRFTPKPRKFEEIFNLKNIGFIKGECIRHTRNTSDPCILSTILTDFKTHLSKRGYSDKEIDPIVRTMENTNRKKYLVKTDIKCKQRQPNVMITKYNPHLKGLKKRILKYWNVLKNDEICKELFTNEPIIAYSKHKNIGEMIIQSRLQ